MTRWWQLLLACLCCSGAVAAADRPVLPAQESVAQGRLEQLATFPSSRIPARPVQVWLPPDYPQRAPYAVLYMHDGQMLFDASRSWNRQAWEVDRSAAGGQAEGWLRPFIVVAVWNAGAGRHQEYFPQAVLDYLDDAGREQVQQARRGEQPLFAGELRADAYADFLALDLKPWIDRHYAVDPAAASTALMGSSMGGLISLYTLARHPTVFGAAACLSTHWPGLMDDGSGPVAPALRRMFVDRLPAVGQHRLWFDHGTATLDAYYPPLQQAFDEDMQRLGWVMPWRQTRVYAGAEHSERDWAARLADPLRFLFGTATPAQP